MTHPTNIPDFQAALGALTAADLPQPDGPTGEVTLGIQQKMVDAQMAASVVNQSGLVMDALKDHVAICALNAARVLAGAAHLILLGNWLGRASEADTVRDAARVVIAPLEPPGSGAFILEFADKPVEGPAGAKSPRGASQR